jgi:membrane peptidoglycan carboxypeptidase
LKDPSPEYRDVMCKLADLSDKLVVMSHKASDFLREIYVVPERRGMGLANKIMTFADGWFIGVSPKLVSGAWVGNDDRSIHFRTSMAGEGLRTALPVVGKYYEKVMKDNSLSGWRGKFDKPSEKISKPYGCQTYLPKNDSLTVAEDSLVAEQ